METIRCSYCECRVLVRVVDDEGGMCPECGAVITGAMMLSMGNNFDDEIDDDHDDRDDDPIDRDIDEDDELEDEDKDEDEEL